MTTYYPRCHALISVVLDGRGAADSRPIFIETRPRSATVNLNGYNEADTWELEFDARVLPIDPDLIRTAAARVYMLHASSLADRVDWARQEYEMVVGLADSVDLEMSSSGQFVRMDGRDYTALLLDREWDPRDRIPAGRPLDQVVQEIVNDAIPFPAGQPSRTLEVAWEGAGPPPITGVHHRQSKKKGYWVKPGKETWTVIYELCLRHGYISYIEGDRLIITEPRVQTAKSLADAPRLVYGTNLASVSISRRLGKERVPQVIASSIDPTSGRVIEVRYPERHQAPTTGIGTRKDERLRVTAPRGITDRQTLERFARTYYENKARSETSYTFGTKYLEDVDRRDLLEIRGGKPVAFEWDAFNAEQMRQLSPAERFRHLRSVGYSEAVALVVSQRFEDLDRTRQAYYVKTGRFTIDNDAGLTVEAEAVNYSFVPREERP